MSARLRFGVFCAVVLGGPAALMSAGDPQLADLGKLVMILSPGLAGLALNLGLGYRGERTCWRWVGWAPAVVLGVAGVALVASLAAGGSTFGGERMGPQGAAEAVAGSALTSVLEELGWAGGGLALAVKALGRRWGVLALGLVWALWHLVPAWFRIGMFPPLEAGPPAMLAAFVVSCLVYRELLTLLVERARSWWAAAVAHAAPNVMFAGLMSGGLVLQARPDAWPLFPAPGGLVFPVAAAVAVWALRRRPAAQA